MNSLRTELRQTPKQKAKGITTVVPFFKIPLQSYSPYHLNQHSIEHDALSGFWSTTVRHDVLADFDVDELVAQFPDRIKIVKKTKDRHWFITMVPKAIKQYGKDVQLTYTAEAQSSARILTATITVVFRGALHVDFDTD